jgi:hypothetical protein
MEPRKTETPVQSRGESQSSPSRPPERKRRFQIVRQEERIAPKNHQAYQSLGQFQTNC